MVKARKVVPRTGRPPVAEADRRDTLVRVLTTEDEHQELQQAAASVSMSVSTWVRSVALERARQMAKKQRQEQRAKQDDRSGDCDTVARPAGRFDAAPAAATGEAPEDDHASD
jgi:hypothetical protein